MYGLRGKEDRLVGGIGVGIWNWFITVELGNAGRGTFLFLVKFCLHPKIWNGLPTGCIGDVEVGSEPTRIPFGRTSQALGPANPYSHHRERITSTPLTAE